MKRLIEIDASKLCSEIAMYKLARYKKNDILKDAHLIDTILKKYIRYLEKTPLHILHNWMEENPEELYTSEEEIRVPASFEGYSYSELGGSADVLESED